MSKNIRIDRTKLATTATLVDGTRWDIPIASGFSPDIAQHLNSRLCDALNELGAADAKIAELEETNRALEKSKDDGYLIAIKRSDRINKLEGTIHTERADYERALAKEQAMTCGECSNDRVEALEKELVEIQSDSDAWQKEHIAEHKAHEDTKEKLRISEQELVNDRERHQSSALAHHASHGTLYKHYNEAKVKLSEERAAHEKTRLGGFYDTMTKWKERYKAEKAAHEETQEELKATTTVAEGLSTSLDASRESIAAAERRLWAGGVAGNV